MTLEDVGIVLLTNMRSKAYLQNLLKNDLIPSEIILLKKDESTPHPIPVSPQYKGLFEPNESVEETLKSHNLEYKTVNATDCNEPSVVESIKELSSNYLIYCGGGILEKEVLTLGKKFIHVHPGIVPKYRGSTCFYYSIIAEQKCGATAFFMEEEIDTGNILAQKEYDPPNYEDLDCIFDPWMRSDLLVDVVKKGSFEEKPQPESLDSETYFIIHPVLKHLAIEYCVKQQ